MFRTDLFYMHKQIKLVCSINTQAKILIERLLYNITLKETRDSLQDCDKRIKLFQTIH